MNDQSTCEHEWVMHTYTFAGNPFWEPFGDVFDRCVHCGATRPVSEPQYKSEACEHEWTACKIAKMYNFCLKCGEIEKMGDPTVKRKLVDCPRCHNIFGVEMPQPVKPPQRTPHSELRKGLYWARLKGFAWFFVSIGGTAPFLHVRKAWSIDDIRLGTPTDPNNWLDMEFGPRIEEPEEA